MNHSSQNKDKNGEPSNNNKNLLQKIWSFLKSWRCLYLMLLIVGQVLSIVWNDPSSNASFYIPMFMIALACIIKLLLLKGKITIKDFVKMQIDFVGPYVLTIINIVLLIFVGISLESFEFMYLLVPNMNSYIAVNCVQLFLGTLICSFVMHKKCATKIQYYLIMLNINIQTASNLQSTIILINSINSTMDSLKDQSNSSLLELIANKISQAQYQEFYEVVSNAINALQSSKDFGLACIASIISMLLILMDYIRRPLQQMQHQQEIYQHLLNHKGSIFENSKANGILKNNRNKELQLNLLLKKFDHSNKQFQLELDQSVRNTI